MQIGDVISWQRTFTEEDIRLFAKFSGDEGEHHLVPDEHGRLMAHGLLTATLPTKIGGDLNFIARQMTFQFHRPVFAGDDFLRSGVGRDEARGTIHSRGIKVGLPQSARERSDDRGGAGCNPLEGIRTD